MKRLQRAAILTELVEHMRSHDSWCGETHVQKATYMLQELDLVELDYDFVLYKHGPFSFDFRDDLGSFVTDGIIRYEPQPRPYGPRIALTPEANRVREIYPKTLERASEDIEFVAAKVDGRGVVDLERLATALYVTREAILREEDGGVEARAWRLRILKPHVPEPNAVAAVEEIDKVLSERPGH
jgi:hypothetical protein